MTRGRRSHSRPRCLCDIPCRSPQLRLGGTNCVLHCQLWRAAHHRLRRSFPCDIVGPRDGNRDIVDAPARETDVEPRGIDVGANDGRVRCLALNAVHGRRICELQVLEGILGRYPPQLTAVARRCEVDSLLTNRLDNRAFSTNTWSYAKRCRRRWRQRARQSFGVSLS